MGSKIRAAIEYGLYLLVFLLPIQTRWIIKEGSINGGHWEYGTISLYGTDILLILLVFLFFVSKTIKNEIFSFNIPGRNKQKKSKALPAHGRQTIL